MTEISMKQLLEAGVHFGHQTSRWNPKMKPYIFGARNGIHIIDLQQTVTMFKDVEAVARSLAASGGHVLFVGTKKQAQEAIKEEAERCGMFYVHNRWLGGTLTNFSTIQQSIERLILCRSCDLLVHRQVGEKNSHCLGIQFARMTLSMKQDEALDPTSISLFGPETQVP